MVSIMEPDQGGYGEPWVWASAVWEREKGLPGDSLCRHPVVIDSLRRLVRSMRDKSSVFSGTTAAWQCFVW